VVGTQLDIPYATLLDLDWGRAGGGEGRIRDACEQLGAVNHDPFEGIDGFTSKDDLDGLDKDQLVVWLNHLEKWNIFFSTPLDLDMTLLMAFRDAYTTNLEPGAKGPSDEGDPRDAVLGQPKARPDVPIWAKDESLENLRWYRYLFLTHSKPGTHLRALSRVIPAELAKPPKRLGRLLDAIAKAVDPA